MSERPLELTETVPGRGKPPAPVGITAGQQLGHFRIDKRLGAGGMGEVYLATDLALDRPVAIKVLPEELARDAGLRDRLIREARAQARVTHSNVGHIYFVGEEAGRLFFAMEYVAGRTLAERIADGPVGVDEALELIRAAALGLREAQRQGITHRDVKPSNLMVDAHGVLKVLDFGLAAGAPGTPADGPVEQTSAAGTPLYMAPEQARGDAIDCRADIYALGATLFHLVSGKPPFSATNAVELYAMHETAARPSLPRRGQLRTQIGAIDQLVAKMMAASPEDRFADYDELLKGVELASNARTRPAGFLARTIARTLDFIFMTIVVAAAWMIAVELGAPTLEEIGTASTVFGLAVYEALAVARWGRTLGKAVLELEVVDATTAARPTLARATRRVLAMLGLPALSVGVGMVLENTGHEHLGNLVSSLAAFAIATGLALLLYATSRVTSKRAVWDRWSSTLVRYRPAREVVSRT